MHFRQDKGVTVHAEHGLMYEDARQHQRAAYYYKQAIMVGSQTGISELDYNVDSVLVGIAEAYDGEWQDTGADFVQALLNQTCLCFATLTTIIAHACLCCMMPTGGAVLGHVCC